jgi:phenylacetate-CoA ligase
VLTPVGQKKPPFWRRNKNQFENQWIYSNYHLGPETAKYYVEHLRSTRVSWIHGYPSTLALLASLISEQDLDPGDTVRIVTMASENVLESQVETICRAFGAEVRQHYGQAEGVANFSECEYGQIHVDEDYTTVEFLPMDDGASRVIGTGVNNSAFFLIRYDTGDRVHEGGDGCECGRSGRIVKSIDGRSEDYIVLPNGSMVGRLDHVFKDMVNVREAQLVQDVRERMKVMIVPLDNYGPDDEKQLLYEFRLRIGDAIELDIDYVERIPRTPSGKLRFVVSSLSSNELGIARDN